MYSSRGPASMFFTEVNMMGYKATGGFTLIVVLFILLVIVGTAYVW